MGTCVCYLIPHFPRAVLDAVGGWDPYNVTEDADLGIRLARQGWHVGVLASTTWEEAPPTFRIWHGQRTRWLKGWMQTYLVHMRRPAPAVARARRAALPRLPGADGRHDPVGAGAPVVLRVARASICGKAACSACRIRCSGNGCSASASSIWSPATSAPSRWTVAAARRGRLRLAAHALLMPVYWLAISYAAYRALWQLVWAPYYWEKTEHAGRRVAEVAGP